MAKITKEELLKIAQISHVQLHEDEIAPMLKQLEDVLSYAERVKEVAAEVEEPSMRAVNVFREDVTVRTDPEPILCPAPDREEDFFVVPKILDN